MFPTAFDRTGLRTGALAVLALCAASPAGAAPASWLQQTASRQTMRIVSSEIAISREQAEIKLELTNGRRLTLSTVAGQTPGVLQSSVSGSPDNLTNILAFGVRRGDALDRSWRQLLSQAMDLPSEDLAGLLVKWVAPQSGKQLDELIDNALSGVPIADVTGLQAPELSDSLTRLQDKINQLEQALDQMEERPEPVMELRSGRRGVDWLAPVRHVGRGVAGIISVLVTFAVLFGLGFVTVFFGGRQYLDGVADAARQSTVRSFLVGLAASFLVIPVFVLGIVVLAISIVGIPGLLVWIPAFPLAIVLAVLLGYLAVAHGLGEAFAERRFYGGDWFSRANSYYYLITGLGLLLALFIASHVVEMAGPWLGFIHGTLLFLGIVLTWGAATTGLGAVLITRAGSKPVRKTNGTESESYADAPSV